MNPRKIYAVESHDQVLGIWRQLGTQNARVLHLDFHCDLRGLLINRKTNRAFRIWERFPELDEGNFLTHAVMEGVVSKIRWVHDEPGGRRDDLKTVKYEHDATAWPHRLALSWKNDPGIFLEYEVILNEHWKGVEAGEILDIDWDFFASQQYSFSTIEDRVEAFMSKPIAEIPNQTFVCYSPGYSHPSRNQFRQFVERLSERFDAQAEFHDRPESSGEMISSGFSWPARKIYHSTCLALRRCGVY